MKEKCQASSLTVPKIDWNWEQANYLAEWHEPIVELMSRYVPKESRILEVGAGGSHTLGALAGRLNCQAFGIEPDVAGIRKTNELAISESAEVAMIRGDGFMLPFDDCQFDVVYSLGLVEHFTLELTEALIAEHFRVCRFGGFVIVAVPNLLNLPHTLRKLYLGDAYEYAPEHAFTPGHLKRMLSSAGLQYVSTDGLQPLWGLGMSPIGWRFVSLFKRIGLARLLDDVKTPGMRARIGYMTYAIGKKGKGG